MTIKNRSSEVAYWIKEREKIRELREQRAPRPWTADPVLASFRFCNVHREDDAVTKWLAEHWRTPHKDHPYLTRAMTLARMINWPPTLKFIGFPDPWNSDEIIKKLHLRLGNSKTWSSAYIVSTNGVPMEKALYVIKHVVAKVPSDKFLIENTLSRTHQKLMTVNGLGSFLAAQVIADLKNTPGHRLQNAPDWVTWAAPGPGSIRGLIRYYNGVYTGSFLAALTKMSEEVWPLVRDHTKPLCMQDWQNVMCEFDKWDRTKSGEGRPKAYYKPNPEF